MNISKKCRVVALCFLVAGIVSSCDENSKLRDQYNSLFTEVIAVHDEIMAEIPEVSELEEKLSKPDSTEISESRQNALKNLKESDDRMMSWMKQFTDAYVIDRTPVAKMDAETLQNGIEGLENELQEVKELRDFTIQSIEEAQASLQ